MIRASLRIGLSVVLIGAVLFVTDPASVLARLAQADAGWLFVCGGLLSVQTVLMATRWWLVARQLGLRLGWRGAVGEYYLAQVVNTTLPGGVLGDVGRAARSRQSAGLTAAAHAVMIERLSGQIAMFAVLWAGLVIALSLPGGIAWPAGPAATLLAAPCLAALGWTVARRFGRLGGFVRATRLALLAPGVRSAHALLALAIAALNLAAFVAAARATGTVLPPEAWVTVVPLILTAMLIPLSVAGWGWREGAAAVLFPLSGADSAAGVAAATAFGLVMLLACLPGALWPLVRPGGARPALPSRSAVLPPLTPHPAPDDMRNTP